MHVNLYYAEDDYVYIVHSAGIIDSYFYISTFLFCLFCIPFVSEAFFFPLKYYMIGSRILANLRYRDTV